MALPWLNTSDTALGISNGGPSFYYHRLPRSLALAAGRYLFAVTQWESSGSFGLGVDTDRNDQSAWYRSADDGVEQWAPAYTFWGEQTAPVYMLRPVFGAPGLTVSNTEEALAREALEVQIAPNPVSDRLYVKVNAVLSETFQLQLSDINGKILLETALRNDPGHRTARSNLGEVHLMLAAQAWELASATGPVDVVLLRRLEGVRALLAAAPAVGR